MSIQILVRDRNDKPMPNVDVRVQFKDGFANVRTDGAGSAELKVSGYIKHTEVYGKKRAHETYTKDVEQADGCIIHKMP